MADSSNGNSKVARENGEDRNLEKHEPPHTTQGGVTSPKFGSAGSGGAEYEQLPEQHEQHQQEDLTEEP